MAKNKAAGSNAPKNDPNAFLAAAKKGAAFWKKTRTEAPSGGGVPDIGLEDGESGTYAAKLVDAILSTKEVSVTEGRTKKKVQAAATQLKFSLTEEPNVGKVVTQFQTLNNDIGYKVLSETLQKLGYDTAEMELTDLPGTFAELKKEKPEVDLFIKRADYEGKPQLKVYVNSISSGGGTGGGSSTASGGEDSFETQGQIVDEGGEGADECQERLEAAAAEAGLDPNDFGPWADLGKALDEAGVEGEAGELPEELSELGDIADDNDNPLCDDARNKLTELGGELDEPLTDDGYETWREFADAIEAAGTVDLDGLGAAADEGDKDAKKALNEYGKQVGLKEADYDTWAEFATAIGEASAE